jgi:hypothetical protein
MAERKNENHKPKSQNLSWRQIRQTMSEDRRRNNGIHLEGCGGGVRIVRKNIDE